MTWLLDWWKEWFGMRWWIIFKDESCMGPMSHASAYRWMHDSPLPYHVEWDAPCEQSEDSVL